MAGDLSDIICDEGEQLILKSYFIFPCEFLGTSTTVIHFSASSRRNP